jgi:hypothetical protein
MASINAMEYEINLMDHLITKPMIDQLMKESEIAVSRKVKGKYKAINIRPFIDRITKKQNLLTIQTRSIDGRTVRIDEILSHLYANHRNGIKSFPIHKTRQFIKTNGSIETPMDLR